MNISAFKIHFAEKHLPKCTFIRDALIHLHSLPIQKKQFWIYFKRFFKKKRDYLNLFSFILFFWTCIMLTLTVTFLRSVPAACLRCFWEHNFQPGEFKCVWTNMIRLPAALNFDWPPATPAENKSRAAGCCLWTAGVCVCVYSAAEDL